MLYDNTTFVRSQREEDLTNAIQGPEDLSVGFGERFSIGNQLTFSRFTETGRQANFTGRYEERDNALMDAGLTDGPLLTRGKLNNLPGSIANQLFPLVGTPEGVVDANTDPVLERNEELIRNIKQSHPELNIKTDSEIEQDLIQEQQDLMDRDKDLQERSNFLGKVGYLTGSALGWLRDPVHAVSILGGAGAIRGAGVAANFLRVGAAEASIEAALTVVEKPGEVEFRRFTGEDVTGTQAVIESGVQVAAAGVLGGAVGAAGGLIGRAIPTAKNPTSAVSQTSEELLERFKKEVTNPTAEQTQSAELLDELLDISKASPNGAGYEKHLKDYADARKSITEGRDVDMPDEGISSTKVEPPEGSKLADTDVTPDEEDLIIQDVRNSLEAEDVTFTKLDKDNQVTSERSAREIMEELDAEEKAIRDTISCFNIG